MNFQMVQLSSLEKVRENDSLDREEICRRTVLAGERLSYQICMRSEDRTEARVFVESELAEHVKLYLVKSVFMDLPTREKEMEGEGYLSLEPGMMPDVLVPLEEQKMQVVIWGGVSTVWVRADIPKDTRPGNYQIKICLTPGEAGGGEGSACETSVTMQVQVLPVVMPKQRLIYTRWFYADCIAGQHQTEIYSERHWELIDKYIAAAADMGINMILVPIHTPPLDTEVGTARPCVQLVDIEKKGDRYEFSFDRFRRFIRICKENGIRYFEMAHMFSQWGAKCAANILVTENGKTDYLFGWHVAADDREYVGFLKQYLEAVTQELAREGILENTYFHVSDEPSVDVLDNYKTASDMLRSLAGGSKIFDALSNYEFYEKGLVECPVTCVGHIHEFLEHDVEEQWVYYCCEPEKSFPNSFLAMPSCRVRILGFLLYKYDIKGFLHWGFNYYNARVSRYPVNPYLTTSGDRAYPSGDPFIVYPGRDGVYSSLRGEVFYEGIKDMAVCFALDEDIGRKEVVALIDRAAGFDLRFDRYPEGKEFLEGLRAQMIRKISECAAKESHRCDP